MTAIRKIRFSLSTSGVFEVIVDKICLGNVDLKVDKTENVQ